MNMINLTEAKTAELVAFYNENCSAINGNPVKKFADRKTAERRVGELMATMEVNKKVAPASKKAEVLDTDSDIDIECKQRYGMTHCPHCNTHLSNGVGHDEQEVNGNVIRHNSRQFECLACGEEFGPIVRKPKVVKPDLSTAIAKSWQDPAIKEKRCERHCVFMTDENGKTVEVRSVRQAFVDFSLPLKEHIKFRMELKAAGKIQNRYGFDWEVQEL